MAVPYEEYTQWKESGVTAELVEDLERAMSEIANEILNREYADTARDQLLRGYLRGLAVIRDWVPDFTSKEVEEND